MASGRRSAAAALAAACLAVGLYLVITPWVLRPWLLGSDLLPRDAGAYAPMENADLYLNAWILAWIARATMLDPTTLFDGNAFHPAANTIAGSENMLAHLPVTVPAWAVSGSALVVLKAMAVESFVLAGLCMFLLARRQTGSMAAALLAGAAFTFAPWRVQSFPHPQYLGTQYLPLALLAVDVWVERRTRGALVGLAAALALQILACLYLGYFSLFGVAAYAAARLWWGPVERRWNATAWLGGAMALGGIAVVPIAIPYLKARAAGIIPPFDPSRFQGHTWAPWSYLSPAFVGLGGLVVVLVALDVVVRTVRRGRAVDADADDANARSQRRALWTMAATGVLLSTGPYLTLPGGTTVPTPYLLLYRIVPGFSAIRGPRRFFILVLAALSALLAHAFVRWTRALPPAARGALALVLVLGCAVAAAPHPSPVLRANVGADTPPVYRWLAQQPGDGAVLEIPGSAIDGDLVGNLRNAEYMLASTTHWRPILNGFSGYEPPSSSFLTAAIRRLPDPRALDALVKSVDVRWIVLHRDRLAGSEIARWANVDVPGLARVATFGDAEVYEVTLPTDGAWRDGVRTSPPPVGRTLTGLPTSPLAPECRKARILGVDMPPVIALVPFPVPITVRFANDSSCTWPAVAVRTDGLVGLTYRWYTPAGELRAQGPFSRLLADVPPGATVEDTFVVIPPGGVVSDTAVDTDVVGESGRWRLDVVLEQSGVAEPLATQSETIQLNPMRAASPEGS
ncbi:MAG: hypothetical protein U0842_20560 [Candidatus Binatia bacterium]